MGIPIGLRVRQRRLDKGRNGEWLAEKAGGRNASWLYRIESGQQDPKYSELVALAKALDITVAELVAEPPQARRRRA